VIRGARLDADFFILFLRVQEFIFYIHICIKNEETRLDAFEMKGPRKILWVSWRAKKTNEWVFGKAGVKRELFSQLDTVKRKEASIL